jgi:acyl-coenzyme A thioesterase PaaI-like protein
MKTLELYQKLSNYPFGKKLFAYFFCRKLPYFFSIKPLITELEVGRAVVQMKDRRSVHNHLRGIHAIALCNLCEAAMAMVTEATIPKNLRFIPVGMTVEYKKKANGTIRGISEIRPEDFKIGKVDVPVHVFDGKDINVMSAVITLDIKERA